MKDEIKRVIRIWKIIQNEAPNLKGDTTSAMDDALLDLEGLLERSKDGKYNFSYKLQDEIRDITDDLSKLTKKANTAWKDIMILNMME